MHLLLLTTGLLLLAAACGLLLAGARRARSAGRPSAAALPSALSPLARRRAIQAYQVIHAMELPANQAPQAAAPRTTPGPGPRWDDEEEPAYTFAGSSAPRKTLKPRPSRNINSSNKLSSRHRPGSSIVGLR